LVAFGFPISATKARRIFGSLGGYENDADLDEKSVLTGATYFVVREIEIFEITE
jgi:hypothetical protein